MNLNIIKNNVSDLFFELLLNKYPTGYTNDKLYPNLLFLLNKPTHIKYVLDNLEIDVNIQNSVGDLILSSSKYEKNNNNIDKINLIFELLNKENKRKIFEQYLTEKLTFDMLKNIILNNDNLLDLTIKKYYFFENISDYAKIIDVNKVISDFFIKTKEKTEIKDIVLGYKYRFEFEKEFDNVALFLNKENLFTLIDNEIFSKESYIKMLKSNIINEKEMMEIIKEKECYNLINNKNNISYFIDENTGYFKENIGLYEYLNKTSVMPISMDIMAKYINPEKIEKKSPEKYINVSYFNTENLESFKLFKDKGLEFPLKDFLGIFKNNNNSSSLLLCMIFNLNELGYNIFQPELHEFLDHVKNIVGKTDQKEKEDWKFVLITLEKNYLLKKIPTEKNILLEKKRL